jgi:hypothetical protein
MTATTRSMKMLPCSSDAAIDRLQILMVGFRSKPTSVAFAKHTYEREQSTHLAMSLRVGRFDVRLLFLTLTLNLLQLHFIDLSFHSP